MIDNIDLIMDNVEILQKVGSEVISSLPESFTDATVAALVSKFSKKLSKTKLSPSTLDSRPTIKYIQESSNGKIHLKVHNRVNQHVLSVFTIKDSNWTEAFGLEPNETKRLELPDMQKIAILGLFTPDDVKLEEPKYWQDVFTNDDLVKKVTIEDVRVNFKNVVKVPEDITEPYELYEWILKLDPDFNGTEIVLKNDTLRPMLDITLQMKLPQNSFFISREEVKDYKVKRDEEIIQRQKVESEAKTRKTAYGLFDFSLEEQKSKWIKELLPIASIDPTFHLGYCRFEEGLLQKDIKRISPKTDYPIYLSGWIIKLDSSIRLSLDVIVDGEQLRIC